MLEPLPRCSTTVRPPAAFASKLRQNRGDVLVGQAVEAVAADALRVQLRGQREHLRDLRVAAVERGVEAGHLRQLRRALQQQADRRQVVRLMQRRERNELLQRLQHAGIQRAPAGVYSSPPCTTRWPTPTRRSPAEVLPHVRHQMVERAGVAQLGALAPGLLRLAACPCDPARRSAARCRCPSIWPRSSSSSSCVRTTNSENLMLEEPAFRTAMASDMRSVTGDS